MKKLHKNVMENMFHSDFHVIFTKIWNLEIGNDIHNFRKFLLILELGRGHNLALNQA